MSQNSATIKKFANMVIWFEEHDILYLGLTLAGHAERSIDRTRLKKNLERFEAKYYASPETCCEILFDLQVTAIDDARVEKPNPRHLLIALNYLKEYPTDNNLAGMFGCNEKTAKKWANFYVRKIQALKEHKIKFLFDQPHLHDETFIMTVDGVHCRICEPRTDPSAKWYSKKFNKAGFAYEVGIAIFHNQICWINGPFPAGHNDMKIFREDLIHLIPEGKMTLCDMGYRGEPGKCSYRNPFDSKEVKHFKKRALARQETGNSRLKSFQILEDRFRTMGPKTPDSLSREEKHRLVFVACAVIIQYQMDSGRPLFTV